MKFGYALSSEEHEPNNLIDDLVRAEELGFTFALISDHYHPWVSAQGQNPFIWAVLGGIARATKSIRIGTGVTCPIIRIHPAILAQAAATVAQMMPGRFFFGVGTGENLNEHILGDRWPPHQIRAEMLEEAIDVIRTLWTGELTSYWGEYYTVEDARLYTLPEQPPEIMIAAGGTRAAKLAGRLGDGLINVSADEEIIKSYQAEGGSGPRIGKLTGCWARTKEEALDIAMEIWPTAALAGDLSSELRTVAMFEGAAQMARREDLEQALVCGPDPEPYLEKVREYEKAGFDHVYFHQIGHDQQGFFDFYRRELADPLAALVTA